MKLTKFLPSAVLLAACIFSVNSFAAYRFEQTSGRLYNYSGQTITGWDVIGNCSFTPIGFEKSPKPCGEARAKIAVDQDGHFTLDAFNIPDSHRGAGRVTFTLTTTLTVKDGTKASLKFYDNVRLEEGVKALTLWGINPHALTFLLRDGSPADSYFEKLAPGYILASLAIKVPNAGNILFMVQETYKTSRVMFPLVDGGDDILRRLNLTAGAPPAGLRLEAQFKVENPYLYGPERLLASKTARLTFSPDLMQQLVGPSVRLNVQ